jgi:hypothetical protein
MKPLLAIAFLLAAVAACDDSTGELGGPGAACGGRSGVTCTADQYCDFGGNRCGADDVSGVCKPRPDSCPPLLVPERTCGCDQIVYSSACEANLAGTDLNASGNCALDPGAFACGFRQCKKSNQYCQRSVSDVGGEPDTYTCLVLPAACGGTASCSCLPSQSCGGQCAGDSAGGLTLTCPGG